MMIGILAGMGPKSTGPFVDQVVSAFQRLTGAKDDIEFPPMLIYSLPTPFYVDRPVDHTLMQKTIAMGLKKLEEWGASFIAMPCNTAHLYFSGLQQGISIPILNMVEETLEKLSRSADKVTILGTRPTLEAGIYQRGLQQAHFKEISDPFWQKLIDEILVSIKSSSNLEKAVYLWEDLSGLLKKAGVETLILACTDLNVLFQRLSVSFQVVDASVCLAEAIVRKWETLYTETT